MLSTELSTEINLLGQRKKVACTSSSKKQRKSRGLVITLELEINPKPAKGFYLEPTKNLGNHGKRNHRDIFPLQKVKDQRHNYLVLLRRFFKAVWALCN